MLPSVKDLTPVRTWLLPQLLCSILAIAGAAAAEPRLPGMVRVSPGTFVMGSDDVRLGEKPTAHVVEITRAFYIGEAEVTVAEFRRFDPLKKGQARHPVTGVTWHRAQAYVAWFNDQLSPRAAYRYRLCTEAEWEYAARGGTSSTWMCGDDPDCLADFAWFVDTTWELRLVKTKRPNAFGLYDMYGNAAEWVADYHADYDLAPQRDPTGPPTGWRRVHRGGAFHSAAKHLRAASRDSELEGHADASLGLRLCASVEPGRWT